jgi:hypothetical protein
MLRKLSAAVAAVLLSASLALAANLPLFSGAAGGGCSEASQLVPCLNQTIQAINSGVAGLLGSSVVQATTTQTTIQTLGTVTLPAGTLASPGQSIRIKAFGTGTATGTNTLTVQVGTATAFAVAGAATTAGVFEADVMVLKTGSNTQQIFSQGQFNATIATPTEQSGTLTDTNPITITVSGTSTTSGNFTLNGVVVEQIK